MLLIAQPCMVYHSHSVHKMIHTWANPRCAVNRHFNNYAQLTDKKRRMHGENRKTHSYLLHTVSNLGKLEGMRWNGC